MKTETCILKLIPTKSTSHKKFRIKNVIMRFFGKNTLDRIQIKYDNKDSIYIFGEKKQLRNVLCSILLHRDIRYRAYFVVK